MSKAMHPITRTACELYREVLDGKLSADTALLSVVIYALVLSTKESGHAESSQKVVTHFYAKVIPKLPAENPEKFRQALEVAYQNLLEAHRFKDKSSDYYRVT